MNYDNHDIVLSVEDLYSQLETKAGTVRAVDGISFDLRKNETLGIVGESGSGKSMTAMSILRLLPKPAGKIVGGKIMLHGEDLVKKNEREMREVRGNSLSMILQDPQSSLNPVFTIGNQLIEALQMHYKGTKKTLQAAAVDGLRKVQVAAPESRVNDYPHQMSGGMKQRVVGAIALAGNPKVIIADEPTTALDVTVQAQYLRLLKDIQRERGLSIIFITHDFGVVAKMCDRLLVMYAGRAVESGNTRDIFNHPKHPYTQALLKSVPSMKHKAERLYSIEGQPPPLWDMPKGCRFASRCEHMEERCRREYPPQIEIADDSGDPHFVNCYKLEAQS